MDITPREFDLQPQDTDYIPYLTVSILVIGLVLAGILQSGTAAAREYENETIKELLLSPARRWAVILGKMLGAFVMSIASVIVVLCVLIFVIGVWPAHWGEVIGFTLLSLLIFIAYGTLLKVRQPLIALAFGTSIPLFFLAGGIGVLAFEPTWLQNIAAFVPLTYGRHALEQAVFYSASDQFGLDMVVLGLSALVAVGLGILAMRRGIAS